MLVESHKNLPIQDILRFDILFRLEKNRVDPASAFLERMIRKTAKRLSEKIMQASACTANGRSTSRPSSGQASDQQGAS
jgi:hypothetical protein